MESFDHLGFSLYQGKYHNFELGAEVFFNESSSLRMRIFDIKQKIMLLCKEKYLQFLKMDLFFVSYQSLKEQKKSKVTRDISKKRLPIVNKK